MTHTLACEDRDFPEWHGGRSQALVWAVEIDDPDLDDVVTAARHRCADYLFPAYERRPHVTLTFAGLAAAPGLPGYDDAALEADLALLRSVVPGTPVSLRVSGWDSFAMVPYLAIEGPWLHTAHEMVRHRTTDGHPMDYRPHVTVGHYRGRWPLDEVLTALRAPLPALEWSVGELSLLSYETHRFAGPLTRVGALDLATGEWNPA